MAWFASKISSYVAQALATKPKSGIVHSTFRRTANIVCDDMTWLSLHPEGLPMHPYAVLVKGAETGCSSDAVSLFLDVSTGEPVTASRSCIRLVRQRTEIDLRGAGHWDPHLRPAEGVTRVDAVRMLEILWGLVGGVPVTSPFLSAVMSTSADTLNAWSRAIRARAEEIIEQVEAGFRIRSAKTVLAGISRAVGLGCGLTPSGDDFLTGLLCGYYHSGTEDGVGERLLVSAAPLVHRTSLPSAMMLRAALRGLFPETLTDLLDPLGYNSNACGAAESLGRLVSTGATSGEDMLAGLLTYMKASAATGASHAAH